MDFTEANEGNDERTKPSSSPSGQSTWKCYLLSPLSLRACIGTMNPGCITCSFASKASYGSWRESVRPAGTAMEFGNVIFVFLAIVSVAVAASRRSVRRGRTGADDGGNGFVFGDSSSSYSTHHDHDSSHHGGGDAGASHDAGGYDGGGGHH